jgi:hypothetical protein
MIFTGMSLACSTVICMSETPTDELRCFMVFLLRPAKKCWRRMGSAKARLGPESTRVLDRS